MFDGVANIVELVDMLPLVSIATANVSGNSSPDWKNAMSWRRPSSWMVKSSLRRLTTGRSSWSTTVAVSVTSSVSVLKTGGCDGEICSGAGPPANSARKPSGARCQRAICVRGENTRRQPLLARYAG
jgi:hypothetical protein